MRHRLSRLVICCLSCCGATVIDAQPTRPVVIVRFDSILSAQISQNHVLQPESYRAAVLTTLDSWYPVGDTAKRSVLTFLAAIRSNASELGMAAAALIPFHDPATVRPILARARNDSVPSFMRPFLVGAASAILSMDDLGVGMSNVRDSTAQRRLALLEQYADEAGRSSIGHVHAEHVRQAFDVGRTAARPSTDQCEGDAFLSRYLVSTIDLRDAPVLSPILDSASSCAVPGVLQALSYASDRDFVAGLDTMHSGPALSDAVAHARLAASQWWHVYLGAYPSGDWRVAARLGLEARGYGATPRELLRALNDPSLRIRYQGFRLLNDLYSTRIDLDPIVGVVPEGVYARQANRGALEAALRTYWTRRIEGVR